MGKVIIYGLTGLVSIGLLIGFGLAVKLLVLTFMGRRKKNAPKAHHWACSCGDCGPGSPNRMHEHHRP